MGRVNFHRRGFFGTLTLASEEASAIGSPLDCSCCAARLFAPNQLLILPSPKPLIEQCPPGSVLVRAKYASVCGSDMPYFKAKSLMAPSSYWDRDGFCGHEVVGKSPRYRCHLGCILLNVAAISWRTGVVTESKS